MKCQTETTRTGKVRSDEEGESSETLEVEREAVTAILETTTLSCLPAVLKVRIVSFLSPRDAVRVSHCSKTLYEDLALAQIPMKIPFKSWYEDPLPHGALPKRGPKIPFLPRRTHSVTLTGSWSCRLGELHHDSNSQGQFFIVAYPKDQPDRWDNTTHHDPTTTVATAGKTSTSSNDQESWLEEGGRIVWASRPLCRRHYPSNGDSSWIKLSVTFVPRHDQVYCLHIQPGAGSHWWRHSLLASNLIAHVTYHDNPHTNFLLKRQYKSIVKHMFQVEDNRGAYYTKILEAVARSIRIQLARFGRNALDPVLESFFQSTGIPRDTDSLLVLEEIARFLSEYAYINERRKTFNNSNTERESTKGSNSHRDSIPDWVPYAESSLAAKSISNKSIDHNAGHIEPRAESQTAAVATRSTDHEGKIRRPGGRRFQKTVRNLWKIPSSLWRASRSSNKSRAPLSWRSSEVTEEFSISVVPPDESTRRGDPEETSL